jgi:hypothetical protein
MSAQASAQPSHPAPHRRRVSATMLLIGLLGAPGGWFLLELGGWALASYHCGDTAAPYASGLMRATMPSFLVLTILAFAISLIGTWFAWQSLVMTRDEKSGPADAIAQLGKGRTRFIAMAALIASCAFTVALLFHVIQMWVAPLCTA